MKTIALKEFWTVLSSRVIAKQISKQSLEEGFNVIFDFSWIKFLGTSFADELFAKPISEGIKNFKITNIENADIKKVIIFVSESRRNKVAY